jgi:prolyl oligopeptidase
MKYFLHTTLIALLCVVISSCSNQETSVATSLDYPETTKVDHTDDYFGTIVEDPYRWLEDDMSEETGNWVKAENEVTFGYLNNIDYREKLVDRIEELLDYERISAPFEEGEYEYFYKNDGLQDHSVLFRSIIDSDDEPEVFLDPNTFSDDGTIALRGVSFTKDGTLAAYMITEGGSDWRKVIAMDAVTKTIIEDTLVNVKFSGLSWYKNEGFYYSSYDQEEEGSQLSAKTQLHKLYYHKIGTSQSDDILVFGGEENPNRYIGGYVTEDQNYLVFTGAQNTSGNQLFVKDLSNPDSEPIQMQEDYMARFSYIDNDGSQFYFRTNIDAPNYRLVKVNLSNPSQWEDVIPEAENVLRTGSGGGRIFANYLVDAQTVVKQFNMDGELEWEVELPGIGSANGFNAKKEDTELYYTFSSFTSPNTIYKYDIGSGASKLYKSTDVDFEPDDYETKQVFYTSKDGTKIPMFITHKKGLELDGSNATYLYGYGGFNISMTPGFSPYRVIWLENGGIYAVANLRGGGEYGEDWHKAGTKMNKQNVFDDFIAAGEYLIENNYTSSEYLAIAGGSNGGLLVGATMTQRPDLAKVALPAVGVLDMLRYHAFTAGAGWSADYGTSEESEEMFQYLKKYSPYHALKPGVEYPATLVTTADHDDRVVPAHSFKFAARLQEYNEGPNPVLIRIQTDAGHGSVSTRQRIEVIADQYAFAWYNMGIIPDVAKEAM